LSIYENSDKIIDNADITATISGTTVWEGLMLGKPGIVFGNPWYSPCRSCYVVKSSEECKIALQKCIKSTKEKVEIDLYKFILYIQNDFIMSSVSSKYAERSPLSLEKQIDNLVLRYCQIIENDKK